MKERKLNYRFHDPNPAAVTTGYILKILIEANAEKVESAIREAVGTIPNIAEKTDHCKDHSA